MARTYRCTKGNHKRIRGFARQFLTRGTFAESRKQSIDYNDFHDKNYALRIRQGIQWNAPKGYRDKFSKRKKSKADAMLHNALKYDEYDNLQSFVIKNDANYYYF